VGRLSVRRLSIARHCSGSNPPSLEVRHLRRNIARSRNRKHRLPLAPLAKQRQDSPRSLDIKLREWVIQQEHRRCPDPALQRFGLQHSQRDRNGSLLPSGSERAQIMPVIPRLASCARPCSSASAIVSSVASSPSVLA